MRTRAAIGILFFLTGACASHDESVGCAQLVVSCAGDTSEQQWWLAKAPTSYNRLQIQGEKAADGDNKCGSWLAFINDGATARYDNVDLGAREGQMRLRVVVAADDANTTGGTLSMFADSETTAAVSCTIRPTGGWWSWVVVDCGPITLGGVHSLTFKFSGISSLGPYVFNFAAFGVVRSGSPDCTVTGPKHYG